MIGLFKKLTFQVISHYRLWSERMLIDYAKNPVLVHTMGKVGSASMYVSLKKELGSNVYFAHTLNEKVYHNLIQSYRQRGLKAPDWRVGPLVYQKIIKRKQPIKIITLIREPIARNISDFFENFDYYTAGLSIDERNDPGKLIPHFHQNYPHKQALKWLDEETTTLLGIDVYAHPFDSTSGYQILTKDNIQLLLLKTELSDRIKEKLVMKFLNLQEFSIKKRNLAAQKPYTHIYQEFKSKIRFSNIFIEEVVQSSFCTQFFSEEESNNIRDQWSR